MNKYGNWLEKLIAFSKEEDQCPSKSIGFLFEETKETQEAFDNDNDLELIDGFIDVAFVAFSGLRKTLRTLGVPEYKISYAIVEMMDAVCQANINKLDSNGKAIKNANGKIMKPEGWQPPEEELNRILQSLITKESK